MKLNLIIIKINSNEWGWGYCFRHAFEEVALAEHKFKYSTCPRVVPETEIYLTTECNTC